jgi:putative DNA primase/helicase
MTPQETLTRHGIALESYAPGRHYTTCPRCSHKRSGPHRKNKVLGITIGDDGSVCWGCNHCAWRGPEKGSGERQERARSQLRSHVYRDKDGVVCFRKVRNVPGREPRFWLEQPDGKGGWCKGTKGVNTKIVYRADEVKKAIADGRLVACVEGEKDADTLWALGIAATCNAHGASEPGKQPKWTKAHSEQLAGADIVVFNDNDPAGFEHAEMTCKHSLGIAKRVRRLDLKPHWTGGEMPKGGDISDWLACGHTREELDALIAQAPDYQAQQDPAGGAIDDAAELEKLARMGPFDYERARKAAGERLGIRTSMLDALVKAKRAELGLNGGDDKQGEAIEFPAVEPWPEPVGGAKLLDEIAGAARKHVVMSDQARDAVALWALHTYVIRRFAISPKLFVRSAVRGCGKSTLLEVLSHLVARPMLAANITTATAFRIIAKHQPTLLIDEVDTFLGDNEELRGILDASHRHDGHVPRLVGDNFEPRNFRVYTAVALSGIGSLHATLMDRAVVVDLQRRRANEPIASLRIGKTGHLDDIARRIVRFIADNEERIAAVEPTMPPGIINRAADNWFVLLAIADVAGGEWPQRARQAAEAARIAASGDEDWLELLLADIRDVFHRRAEPFDPEEQAKPAEPPIDEMTSADLVEALVAIPGHPWAEMGKSRKPLSQQQLARRLKSLAIMTKKIGPKGGRVNGYVRKDFKEAFGRYLPSEGDSRSDTRTPCDEMGTSDDSRSDSTEPRSPTWKCKKPNNDGLVSECPSRKGGNGKKAHVRTTRPRSDDLPYDGPVVEVPDLGPDPLDEHGAPAGTEPCAARSPDSASDPTELCAYCGRPGGNAVAFGDGQSIRLHRVCEEPWIESRMAQEGIWSA